MSTVSDNIAKIIAAGTSAHQWIHGAVSDVVTTDNGPVKTIAAVNAELPDNAIAALSSTSATSNTLVVGTKTFTVLAGKSFRPGQLITAVAANGSYLFGLVVSYSGTTLTMNATKVFGTGTVTSWAINLSGPVGADGANTGGAGVTPTLLTKFDWE
jgi:hypothetical protein